MKHFLVILLATLVLLAAPAVAQTIRTLGYNSTNGQVVAATNIVWTNSFNFSTNTVAAEVRTNLLLGASWLTNTNATNFIQAITGQTNATPVTTNVTFDSSTMTTLEIQIKNGVIYSILAE